MPINSITSEAVRAWLARVRQDSSELQAAKAYRLLRAVLNVAVSDGLIVRNPCNVRGAGQEHSDERPLATAEEIHELADAIQPHLRVVVLLAGFAGLRRGELFGLQRGDVDLDAGELSMHAASSCSISTTGRGSRPTRRARPASAPSASRRSWSMRCAITWNVGRPLARRRRVFVGERGGPLGPVSLQTCFDEARLATGLTQYTLHDLRHAAARWPHGPERRRRS